MVYCDLKRRQSIKQNNESVLLRGMNFNSQKIKSLCLKFREIIHNRIYLV